MLDLSIQTIDTSVKLATGQEFLHWCETALQHCYTQAMPPRQHATWQLNLRIVAAEEAKALNQIYRHKDYATNVLSFYYDDPFTEFNLIDGSATMDLENIGQGDIILCTPIIVTEAQSQQKSILAHAAHLTIHGVLHVCGYDHETDSDAAVMEALEIAILETLGFNNPYKEIHSL